MEKEESEDRNRKEIGLLGKLIGAAVLIGVTFTTCSCTSNQKYSRNVPETYFEYFDIPSHMHYTIHDPFPPARGIYPGPKLPERAVKSSDYFR